MCIYLDTKRRSLWWWRQSWEGYSEERLMNRSSRGGGYLSFSQEDIRDDVRETAAQHQHHTLLAVCYAWHLKIRDITIIYVMKVKLLLCLHDRACALTSAPRRLSEHILQKDSRACRKAGDNFLWHDKEQETKNSHFSLDRLICAPQLEIARPLNDWGLDWASLPESLVLPLSHVTAVFFSKRRKKKI